MLHDAFAHVPLGPAGHFKLYYFAAILHVVDRLVQASESQDAVFERFPFLIGYTNELAACGLDGLSTAEASGWWRDQTCAWESQASDSLPLHALQSAAGLSYETLVAYFCLGLAEEDPRFGVLFETLHGTPGQHLLTYGSLTSWITDPELQPRTVLRQLLETGLIRVANPDAPRFDWALQPTPLLWDVISGRAVRTPELGGNVVYHPPEDLLRLDQLVVPSDLFARLRRVPELLAARQIDALVIRGPRHNGRKTLLGALATELGWGVLEVARPSAMREPSGLSSESGLPDEARRVLGPLATLLNALPVFTYELAPGETTQLPRLAAYSGPVGVAMGWQGGLLEPGQILTLLVEMPSPDERLVHWRRALDGACQTADLAAEATRFRLTSGAIYRTAELARRWATLDSSPAPETRESGGLTLDDVQHAARALNRQSLDTLAHTLPTAGVWSDLAVRDETIEELRLLESRCRHRERLAMDGAPAFATQSRVAPTMGVRALFTGPSGTGKTLAARILASALKMDLYRVDLSSVVNKYIGETEKNLNEVFTRAEELDVVLLIDEGDALLTQRTNVQSSNDRYANLETNFLLQRLETYGGIVLITTNAGERIDSAFQRRMDVVIEFRAPEPAERWAIWQLHLPAQHLIDGELLRQISARCPLTGGQIRNTVLHASVLALENGGELTSEHFESAVRREYRKMGGVYPLRSPSG